MKPEELKFEHGTLWEKTLDRTERALKIGALLPISTESTFFKDGGIDFLVRIISNLALKAEEKRGRTENGGFEKKSRNPFLPHEEEMFVADISDTHVCLLNKFNVIDHHLLIVTRSFEDQEILLTPRDLEAIWTCMAEFEGLVFYNGGEVAGASQKHKHLQMIPLPMAKNRPNVPIEPLFASARFERGLGIVPGLPFVHSFARLDPELVLHTSTASDVVFRLYRNMLEVVGLNRSDSPEKSRQSGPYNFLFTREWMLLVPRSEEFFESISVNALGFAGALLVQNEQQMQILREHGCMSALKHTAIAD
ncbi:MAG: phosphorylase [Deltaproteobacteria bacterium]|nr:phosphorylase [Deltaproteobacteria bacterium]